MMDFLGKLWEWLVAFFKPTAGPASPLPLPKPPGAITPAAPTGKYFLQVALPSGPKAFDPEGFLILQLRVCQMVSTTEYKIIDRTKVRSGLPGSQLLRVASVSQAGSAEPIPEGYYKLGPVEWKGTRYDYNAVWKLGIGATWTDCLPQMPTGRSAIGIHRDANVLGTDGCIGLPSVTSEQLYVAWRDRYPIDWLNVNYGLGTVETKLKEFKELDPVPNSHTDVWRGPQQFIQSPNVNEARDAKIDTIVLHNTEGTTTSAIARFLNAGEKVSAHYIISRTGYAVQMAKETQIAWHAGNHDVNHRSIGIEIEAGKTIGIGMTSPQETTLVALLKHLMDVYAVELKNIIPHRHAVATDCPGSVWRTDANLETWKAAHLV